MTATGADVARAAGISPALVSYVLNDGPRLVSPQARERVLRAVEELDYRPNQIARALRENRTRSIGMLMPDHHNPHFAELAQSVENEAFERNYMLMIGTTDNDSARELGYLRAFVDRQVDGLLISATSDPDVTLITNANIPVLDSAPSGSRFSTVVIDNAQAAENAVRHLLQHGRSNLACISGLSEMEAVKHREAGWRASLAQAAIDHEPRVAHSNFSHEGGLRRHAGAACLGYPPDAVFIISDAQAIGAIRACVDAGVRIPEDISIVSFDDTAAGTFTQPTLTSVDQGIAEMAKISIEAMLDQIQNRSNAAIHRVLQPQLRIRESCGCPPKRNR